MKRKIWIDFRILENIPPLGAFSEISVENRRRVYDIWKSAYKTMINSYDNEKQIIYDRNNFEQGYVSLKRAYNLRIRQLNEAYGFSQINYSEKKKCDGILEILEFFDVVKKNTIKKYLEFRNNIEHRDENTVTFENAISQADYIWMFLKITDLILNKKVEYLVFMKEINDIPISYFQIDLNTVKKSREIYKTTLNIIVAVRPKYISFTPVTDWIEINNFNLISNLMFQNQIKDKISSNFNLCDRDCVLFKAVIDDDDIIANLIKEIVKEGEFIDEFTKDKLFRIFKKQK